MSFAVSAQAYDRFMGRYSTPLAPQFADFAGVGGGLRVVDVGCGPGALTSELVDRVGAANVSAVDPSESFVLAARDRHPGVHVHQAAAEELPFADGAFDRALAQLVVHFMADPVAGLREMARVTRPGGVCAACVWDHGSGQGPLSVFWDAVHQSEPDAEDESRLAGSWEGHLVELFESAGLNEVEQTTLSVGIEHATFEAWWEPFTLGVGPAGAHVARVDPATRDEIRDRCRALFPPAPFVHTARVWAARGAVR